MQDTKAIPHNWPDTPYMNGRQARSEDKPKSANPHDDGWERDDWLFGWEDAGPSLAAAFMTQHRARV